MYTEEEAKTKWCPAIRFTGAGTSTDFEFATNRGEDYFDRSFHCIASECMAWRWDEPAWRGEDGTFYNTPRPQNYQGKSLEHIQGGYCGLAGKSWTP